MERNRDARRAPPPPRRPRLSGPKDASDEDERMDDAPDSRPWERAKKERISSFHVSVSANPRNKRKRQGLQEAQAQVRSNVCDDADESTEETEMAASEDDDEPPPPPPILRRPVKSRGNGKVKQEDEIVMDIPTVPRKARSAMSSSSRFTSNLRRPQEPLPTDASRQQLPVAPQTSLNGISSPDLLGKPAGRRLKSTGTKIRAIKVPKVSEPTTISDQEVEVAEALFVLARSMPSSHAGASESKLELKTESRVEAEVKAASPPHLPPPPLSGGLHNTPALGTSLQTPGSTYNGYTPPQVQNATAEAPKRKRPRVVAKQEEGRAASIRMVAQSLGSYSSSPTGVIHSPVGETEQANLPEKSQSLLDESLSLQSETFKGKCAADSPHPVPQLHGIEDAKTRGQADANFFEEETQNNVNMAERKSGCSVPLVASPVTVKTEASADIYVKNDGSAKMELLNRPGEFVHDNLGTTTKLNIDLMAPLKASSKEEDAVDLAADKHTLSENASINLKSYAVEAPHIRVEQTSEGHKDAKDTGVGLVGESEEESRKMKEKPDGLNIEIKPEQEVQMSSQPKTEQIPSQVEREGLKEGEEMEPARIPGPGPQKVDTDVPLATSSTLSTAVSSSAPVALAGWMAGLPPLGYYGSGAPPWPSGASLPGSNLDGKAAHPAVQLPHAAVLPPLPRMKRCATHVHVANYIYLDQQRSRHTLWTAPLCRAPPYNLNIPPVNILDKEKIGSAYVDLSQKASIQQPGTAFTTSNSMSAPIHSTASGVSVETGAGTASGSVVNMAHAQYIQAMMQQNGFASFSFPFNGPPGQAAQFFNSFYPAHLMPSLPHIQSLAQQAPNLLPARKQQQGLHTQPPHASSSQLLPPLQQQTQQQLQLQLAPQSPSNSQQQQQNHMGTSSTQHFGAHSQKESTAGGESHSMAESRLSAMHRRAKQTSKSQQTQFQGQQPASLSPSMQQQLIPQNTGSGSGLQMKCLDQSVSQGYSPIALSSMNRGSVGPGPLGLVSVASVMATQGHAVLTGSSDNARLHPQQQQNFGGHQQSHQRAMHKTSASVSEDTYAPSNIKGQDFIEDKKSSLKQGGPLNLARVEIEVSSSSIQGSPTSGSSAPPTARLPNNVGRTLHLAASTGARNPRSAPPLGSGQVSQLQNQASKQAMARTKAVSGTSLPPATAPSTNPTYVEIVSLPGNIGKYSATTLPFPAQMAPSSQTLKQSQGGTVKAGQKGPGMPTASGVPPQVMLASAMAKSQGPLARNNQPGASSIGTPPQMPPSVSAPGLSSGTVSLSSTHSPSVPKASGAPASKSPSNGKGSTPMTKSGPVSVKRSPVSGPALSSVMGPGQNLSAKAQLQQKSHVQLPVPQFSQQHSTTPGQQQQQMGTKHQLYQQQQQQQGNQYNKTFLAQSQYRPQLFLQQHHQQYLQQHAQLQQQTLPQQAQQASPHYFQQNPHTSSTQHGHTQQHLRHDHHADPQQQLQQPSSSSSGATANNGLSLSPSLTLGTGTPGNISSTTSSDAADQFQGSGSRANPHKAASSPGNPLHSDVVAENTMMLHPSSAALSGQQANSPHSGSSHYLQLAPVLGAKSIEQKTSPDGMNREELSGIRHLPSSSPSQTPLISNPTSS